MKLSTRIKPISYLKAHAAEIVRNMGKEREPMIITQNGEANLLAPELSLLSTLHQLAWGDDLHRRPLAARPESDADAATAPGQTRLASPVNPS